MKKRSVGLKIRSNNKRHIIVPGCFCLYVCIFVYIYVNGATYNDFMYVNIFIFMSILLMVFIPLFHEDICNDFM